MPMLDWLERRLGRYAIPNLGLGLTLIWGLTLGLLIIDEQAARSLTLDPARVMAGEWWRIFTFFFFPPTTNPIFCLIALLAYHFITSVLEAQWGAFRFNCYVLIGWLGALTAAFFGWWWIGMPPPSEYGEFYNPYLSNNLLFIEAVFLAFATLYPDYQFYIFLIVPVRVKWLALISVAIVLYYASSGMVPASQVAMCMSGYLLFFGPVLWQRLAGARRRAMNMAEEVRIGHSAFHTCAVCGITEKDDPEMRFRVADGQEYCLRHLPGRGPAKAEASS